MFDLVPLEQTKPFQEGREEGREEGRIEGERSLVLRLLARKLGSIEPTLRTQIESLPLVKLEALGEALLDFTAMSDLEQWLRDNR
ncbi:MAG: DUF4351 domain-containing protein [Cyanobacteria bacterium J06626_18]